MKKYKPTIDVAVPEEVKRCFEALAARREAENKARKDNTRVFVSDLVREAMQAYLDNLGIELTVDVDRGGYRERGE